MTAAILPNRRSVLVTLALTAGPWPSQELAAASGSPLVDLTASSKELWPQLGPVTLDVGPGRTFATVQAAVGSVPSDT